jgi:hypothetical protein
MVQACRHPQGFGMQHRASARFLRRRIADPAASADEEGGAIKAD